MTLNEFEDKVNDLWKNHRWLLILLAIPLIILKFRSTIIDLLLGDSSKILKETSNKDSKLGDQQKAANTKADKIIEDANKEREESDDKKVNEDWNKK